MSELRDEIDANRVAFFSDWTAEAQKNWAALEADPVFVKSYRRLVSLQALKAYVVGQYFTPNSAAFFIEAHNDALVSHVNASIGAWRSALQALRSCVENILNAVYYNDHPVELELWSLGHHKLSFTELFKYMESHPRVRQLGLQLTGLATMKAEYRTLSMAVHASASQFRMTDKAANVLLWSANKPKAAMWSAREGRALEAICLLLVCMHRDEGVEDAEVHGLGFSLLASCSFTILSLAAFRHFGQM